MSVRSNTLFHFTKSLDVLKLVLKNGFWPRYCQEDCHWHGLKANTHIAFPMVCFCDIPISRIGEHMDFYGSFGIGLTKEWALRNQLNPIVYLATNSPLEASLKKMFPIMGNISADVKDDAMKTMRTLFSYAKPLSGIMVVGGVPVTKDFYQESEWRHVPDHNEIDQYLRPDEFGDAAVLDRHNAMTRQHCMLRFAANDVRYIFVPLDSDIPAIINFLQTELDHFSNADLKVLMSRVTSLESLQHDI